MNCHVGLFETNQCDNPLIYQSFKANPNYVNLWYHRDIQTFDLLTAADQNRLKNNDIFSFYTKAIVSSSQTQLLSVTFTYNAYATSEMISFPAQKFNLKDIPLLPNCPDEGLYTYDPRCRIWYESAIQQKGQIYSPPYQFAFDGTIGMTISQRFDDSITNQMETVIGLDYNVKNLIERIFKPQDRYTNSSLFQGYTVFFHSYNNTDWESSNGVDMSWEDLEYGVDLKSSDTMYQQKIDFTNSLEGVKNYCFSHIGETLGDIQDSEPYFFKFSKKQDNYISIVYPVMVKQIQSPFTMESSSNIVMFVARVQNDKSNILQSSSWEKRITYLCNFLQPFLILVIIFGCIMHYAAVLVFRIEVPIKLLKTFITQRVQHYESLKKNPNQKNLIQIDATPVNAKTQGLIKLQNDRLNLNKHQQQDKIAFLNTSIVPLKERQPSQESGNQFSEKAIKQLNPIEGLRKNTSLMITCDRNSESLNQLEKYCDDEKIQGSSQNQQSQFILPSQLSQNNSPQQTQSQKQKQAYNNRGLIQLNSNILLRKSSDTQIVRQQHHIFSHLCSKQQKYSHGSKCDEQDEQSEVDSGKNTNYHRDKLLQNPEKTDRKDLSMQQQNAFQNSILESHHPIHIIPNQQTPRLENDRDEEFQELNQQAQQVNDNPNNIKLSQYYRGGQEQINIPSTQAQNREQNFTDKQNSTSSKKIIGDNYSPKSQDVITLQSVSLQQTQLLKDNKILIVTPSTPQEIQKKSLQSLQKGFNQQKSEEIMVQTEAAQHQTHSTYLVTDIEQGYQQNELKFKHYGSMSKNEQKQVKGINFFQRTQSFLKQQLAQIKSSAKQFKASFTPRQQPMQEIDIIQKTQMELPRNRRSQSHQNDDPITTQPDQQYLQQQAFHQNQLLTASMVQSEFDVDEFMQQNGVLDTVVHLEDIKTYSHEIEVIVSTFKHLFSVISYMEEGYEKEDFTSSLFSLNRAVTIFKYINNISAVGMAYFDIGNLYFGQERFEEAIERYSISLSCAFQQFEVNSLQHFNEVLSTGQLTFDNIALSQFLSRLYFISLAFKEQAISYHDDIQLIGRDAQSNYLLTQSALHFKTCLRVVTFLQKLQQEQFKLHEIVIFIYLFLSEVYVYLNEDLLSECTLKEATKNFEQLVQKNRQKNLQQITGSSLSPAQQRKISIPKHNSQKNNQHLIEEIYTIRTAFYFVRGVIQIKKGFLKDGCSSLTTYLEKTQAYQYQQKSLFFLKNIFRKESLQTNTIEKRIEKITHIAYDIFILIDVLELSLSHVNRQSLQLKILNKIKQQFLKPEDKVCVIFYNQDFYILQPLMIFQNKKHWDICFENIKSALKNQKAKSESSNYQQSFDTQIALLNQNNHVGISSPSHPFIQSFYSPTSHTNNTYTEWEKSVFKSLKEMSLQEIATPLDIAQVKRKSILLTFCFSPTSPIHSESKFTQNFATLLDTFHKQPTVISFFCQTKPESQTNITGSQKLTRFQDFNCETQENQFLTQGSHQQILTTKNQMNRLTKMSVNKNPVLNYNSYRLSFINTPSSQQQTQQFRTREYTYDLIDDQPINATSRPEGQEQLKRIDTMPTPHNFNQTITYELPQNKIKKFHIFTKEQDLYTYLQYKRIEKGNFYILQRRFFK